MGAKEPASQRARISLSELPFSKLSFGFSPEVKMAPDRHKIDGKSHAPNVSADLREGVSLTDDVPHMTKQRYSGSKNAFKFPPLLSAVWTIGCTPKGSYG